MGAVRRSLVRRRPSLSDAKAIGSARGHAMGVRPRDVPAAQRRCRWGLARKSRSDHRLPAADAGGLRPRVSEVIKRSPELKLGPTYYVQTIARAKARAYVRRVLRPTPFRT